jgi:hypothetical protein
MMFASLEKFGKIWKKWISTRNLSRGPLSDLTGKIWPVSLETSGIGAQAMPWDMVRYLALCLSVEGKRNNPRCAK